MKRIPEPSVHSIPGKVTSPWIILPGGTSAINRSPLQEIPSGCRQATLAEFISAMYGSPFPWGFLPEARDSDTSPLWKKYRMGYGGLFHHKWFICKEGRIGGAENVLTTLPGSMRHGLLLHGGSFPLNDPEQNEGIAVVRDITDTDSEMYRRVQVHAMERVSADRGNIIISPRTDDGIAYVGMVGRCLWCPNRQLITLPQLKAAVPGYQFELWPEFGEGSSV